MDSDNEDSNLVIDEDAIDDATENPESPHSADESSSGNEEITSTKYSNIEKKKPDSAFIKKSSDEAISENENFPPKKRHKCFNCSKCNKKIPILEGFNNYKKVHEGGKFECSECKYNTASSTNVPQNMQIYANNKYVNSSNKIKHTSNSTKSIDVLESQKRRKLPPLFRIKSKSRSDQIDDVDYPEKGVSTLKKHENEFKKLDKSLQKSSNYFKEVDSEAISHNEQNLTANNSKRFCESDVHVSESEEEGDIEISISGDSGIGSESGECEANERLKFRDSSMSSRDMKQVRLSSNGSITDMKKSCGIGIKGRKNIEYKDSLEKDYRFKKSLKLTNVDISCSANQANKSFKSASSERLQPNSISGMKLQQVPGSVDIEGYKSVRAVSYSKYLESTLIPDGSNDLRKQNPDYPIFIVLDNTSKDDSSNISQTGQGVIPECRDYRSIVEDESPINNTSLLHKKLLGKHLSSKLINHIPSHPNMTKASESQECKIEGNIMLDATACSKYIHSKSLQQSSICGPNKKEFIKQEKITQDNGSYNINHSLNEKNKKEFIKEELEDHEQTTGKVRIIDESKESINDSSTSVYIKSSQSNKTESGKKEDVQYIFMNYIIDGKSTKTKLAHIPNIVQPNQGKMISGEKSTNEQPLNLSMQSSSTSSCEDTANQTLIDVKNPILHKNNENIILNRGEIHQNKNNENIILNRGEINQNNVIYMSNSDFERQKMYYNEEIASKESGSPPLYELNDQGQPIRDIDLPLLSDANCDKRRKKSMHRKRVPLYAQPEPDDPEERNRWHRARVTEKNRRERNKEAMRVETERDILKSQLQEKDNIINELRFKLTNTEASTAILQARNSELEEKVTTMNSELTKKQERIDGQWLLFQNLVKKQAMSM